MGHLNTVPLIATTATLTYQTNQTQGQNQIRFNTQLQMVTDQELGHGGSAFEGRKAEGIGIVIREGIPHLWIWQLNAQLPVAER